MKLLYYKRNKVREQNEKNKSNIQEPQHLRTIEGKCTLQQKRMRKNCIIACRLLSLVEGSWKILFWCFYFLLKGGIKDICWKWKGLGIWREWRNWKSSTEIYKTINQYLKLNPLQTHALHMLCFHFYEMKKIGKSIEIQ